MSLPKAATERPATARLCLWRQGRSVPPRQAARRRRDSKSLKPSEGGIPPLDPTKKSPDRSGLLETNGRVSYIFLAGAASVIEVTVIIFLAASSLPLTVTSLAAIFAAPSWSESSQTPLSAGV